MASFQVRVVLYEADWDDYEALHTAMGENGFSRTLTASDGKVYQLPDAEYRYKGVIDLKSLGERVNLAAKQTDRKYAWLATEVAASRFHGLDTA